MLHGHSITSREENLHLLYVPQLSRTWELKTLQPHILVQTCVMKFGFKQSRGGLAESSPLRLRSCCGCFRCLLRLLSPAKPHRRLVCWWYRLPYIVISSRLTGFDRVRLETQCLLLPCDAVCAHDLNQPPRSAISLQDDTTTRCCFCLKVRFDPSCCYKWL